MIFESLIEYRKFSSILASAIIAFGFIRLIKVYFAGGVCKSKSRLDGKTVVITGANTGIGKETALELAKRGARVIIACRNLNKAIDAANEIRFKSGNGNVIVELLDLSSLNSVKKFASKINSQEDRLDILINNAGLVCPKQLTVDGYDMIFATNHLGHFLLTNLLLEKMIKSSPSRIINVSSKEHANGKMNWNDLMYEKSYNAIKAYRQSKLANVLFTYELAKKLKNTGVTVYALHPGVVNSEFFRHFESNSNLFKIVYYLSMPIIWLFFKTSKQGAQTSVYCAVEKSLDSVTGRYYSDCKEKQFKTNLINDEDAFKLWKISEELTNK